MELILIRHGLPEKVIRDDGAPADPPLSEEGLTQADKVAAWLQHEKIDSLYSSPMKRAYQTAEPIAAIKQLDIEVEPAVAEYDRDADHYIPVEQLKEVDYERWKKLMSGEPDIDFDQFAETVCEGLSRIVAANPGRRVAVTCHGGVVNVWAAHVLGFTPRMFFNPNYTSISRFMIASTGERSVITLNEHHHIKVR